MAHRKKKKERKEFLIDKNTLAFKRDSDLMCSIVHGLSDI